MLKNNTQCFYIHTGTVLLLDTDSNGDIHLKINPENHSSFVSIEGVLNPLFLQDVALDISKIFDIEFPPSSNYESLPSLLIYWHPSFKSGKDLAFCVSEYVRNSFKTVAAWEPQTIGNDSKRYIVTASQDPKYCAGDVYPVQDNA